jgi:hypothetical protein
MFSLQAETKEHTEADLNVGLLGTEGVKGRREKESIEERWVDMISAPLTQV